MKDIRFWMQSSCGAPFFDFFCCIFFLVNTDTLKEAKSFLNAIVKGVLFLLNKKTVVSEDLLILSFEYCRMLQEHYTDSEMLVEFIQVLNNCVQDCLDSSKSYPVTDTNYHTKIYKYHWFKSYLLQSNLWLCKYDSKNRKEEHSDDEVKQNEDNLLYFHIARKGIEKALYHQKEYIWENVENEEKLDSKSWNELLRFGTESDNSYKHLSSKNCVSIRQDKIEHGIVSNISKEDIYTSLPMVDGSDYDIFNEANNKMYLTQCLIFAHKMNNKFQNDIKNIFSNINQVYKKEFANENKRKIYHVANAPVKLYARCVIKSVTDYANEAFPSSSAIVDLLRASVTFESSKDMLYFLKAFINMINNNNKKENKENKENELYSVIKVIRIKNGFSNMRNWKNINDADYCDIKLNIIIYDKKSNTSVIGELQFLTKFLLVAKKKGHKLYGIVRRQEFIQSINNMVLSDDKNYEQYKTKIDNLIKTENVNYLIKEMIWKPNIICSFIHDDGSFLSVFLARIGETNPNKFENQKFSKLYFALLLHFGENILGYDPSTDTSNGSKESEGRKFFQKYFNFDDPSTTIAIDYRTKHFMGFYGKNKDKYSVIEYFLNHKCFDGLSQQSIVYRELLYFCARFNDYQYMKLLIKYKNKCKKIFEVGINWENSGYYNIGLNAVLKGDSYFDNQIDDRTRWIKLFLVELKELVPESEIIKKQRIEKGIKIVEKHIDSCPRKETNEKEKENENEIDSDENSTNKLHIEIYQQWLKMLNDYLNKHYTNNDVNGTDKNVEKK